VNCDKGLEKVTLPLLFTNTVEVAAPKKFSVKPSATAAVEPSSFAAKVFARKPGRLRTAVESADKVSTLVSVLCGGVGSGGLLICAVSSGRKENGRKRREPRNDIRTLLRNLVPQRA
jgi:hypothetical protein